MDILVATNNKLVLSFIGRKKTPVKYDKAFHGAGRSPSDRLPP